MKKNSHILDLIPTQKTVILIKIFISKDQNFGKQELPE